MRKRSVLPIIAMLSLFLLASRPLWAQEAGKDDDSEEVDVYATLTWDAPTTNTDKSMLTDLKGYNIYYHRAPSGKSCEDVPGPKFKRLPKNMPLQANKDLCPKPEGGKKTVCTYDVSELDGDPFDDGPYCFYVTAVNEADRESDPSNRVKK